MNKKIKNDWIKALLSGKYKQGKNKLKPAKNRHCCLGVLCAISPWKNTYTKMGNYEIWNTLLPDKIRDWAGLKSNNPINLTIKNDDEDLSFAEIAEIIRIEL